MTAQLPFRRRKREARRALCVGSLVRRGFSEQLVQTTDEPGIVESNTSLVADLEQWLVSTRLDWEQSPEERRMFSQPLGSWPHQDIVNVSWRAEALGVLVWALSRLDELPSWDTQLDLPRVLESLPFLGDPVELEQTPMRAPEEIRHLRDLAELWHWRARTTQLQDERGVELSTEVSLENIIADAAESAHQAGDIPPPLSSDFPAFGKPYSQLDPDEYAIAMSIARERHFALNWLCGYSKDWDTTPTDT